MTAEEALDELLARFQFHLETSRVIYGLKDEDTAPTLQAFEFAVMMTQALKKEITDAND